MASFRSDFALYVGRVSEFSRRDWLAYAAWVGTVSALFVATGAFLLVGRRRGAELPEVAWLIPLGAALFALSIAIDTIGHKTIYREALAEGEALVHRITIALGVASVVLLVLAYGHPIAAVPALVTTGLSVVYSLVDEALHWRRYFAGRADRIEMWSHVGILTGHMTMMLAWWWWYFLGYPGVARALEAFS